MFSSGEISTQLLIYKGKKKMNYINTYKRLLVNSVNQIAKRKLIFDFDVTTEYEFRLLDKQGKIIVPNSNTEYYIVGSLTEDNKNIIFYSDNFRIEDDTLIFRINSDTQEYLQKVKNRDTNIYIQIGEKSESNKVILMDQALANNRLYFQGTPQPIRLPQFYTKSEIDKKLDELDVPTKTSELENDSGYITSSDIPTVPTKVSELENDSDFVTSEDIPTKTSDLTNDSDFVTSSEVPKKTSDLENDSDFVIDSEIPKYTTDLINDSGYITLYDLSAYHETTSIQFADYVHYKCTVPQTNIQLNLTQIPDTVCVFTTGDTVDYTVSFVEGMNVNKPFEFQPNKTYAVAIDNYLVVWDQVVEGE